MDYIDFHNYCKIRLDMFFLVFFGLKEKKKTNLFERKSDFFSFFFLNF